MESKDMVSSCLDKDEQELQRLCEIKKEMKNKFNNIFHNFQKCIHGLHLDWFHQSREYAFQFLFGEKFQSFKDIFDNNIDQLKKQLDKEELHECDSKTCLSSNLALQKKIFKSMLTILLRVSKRQFYLTLILSKKRIDERACHEEELRITQKDVKDKQARLEMKKQETVVQKSKCSSREDNSNDKREKQQIKENYKINRAHRIAMSLDRWAIYRLPWEFQPNPPQKFVAAK
ncbi:hypothetical protein Tco_0575492 [Tanacetum coccineum]